jgi:hypothetical protein
MTAVQDDATSAAFLPMLEMIQCYRVAQPIHVVAVLRIADLVADTALTARELAHRTNTDTDALYRTLRVVACAGILTEDAEHRFGLTPYGTGLREGGPLRALAMLLGGVHYQAWGDLLETVRTGQPAFPRVFGKPFLDYMAGAPELRDVVNRSMSGLMQETVSAMTAAYDFGQVATMVDVGGGQGALVQAVLARHPDLSAVLVELPPVAAAARAALDAGPFGHRVQTVGGSFFDELPPGGDVYVLSRILQGLDNGQARVVLDRCAEATPVGGRVLIGEMVITDHSTLTAGEDLHMMLVTTGGRIRTEDEHRRLLEAAGFHVARVLPTSAPLPFTLIEGIRI